MDEASTLGSVLAEGGEIFTNTNFRLFNDGVVVNDWQILALLGKGGNGEVYRVKHVKSGMLGALKVPLAVDSRFHSRFDRELEVLQQIAASPSPTASRHLPHLVDKGTIAEKGVPYFVIEFLKTLKLPKQSSEVRNLVLSVCEAVRELHERGYLHRDIKIQNLMQRANGDVVLIDFGLAARIEDFDNPLAERVSMTQGRVAGVGTEGSTAPEQLYGHASVKSDVFSIGALARKCFNANIPEKWKPIILKATDNMPEYRYHNIEEFASAVKRCAASCGWIDHIRQQLILLVVVIVCGLGIAGYLFAMHRNKKKLMDANDPIKKAVAIENTLNQMSAQEDMTWSSFSGSYFCHTDESHRQRLKRVEEKDPVRAAEMRTILEKMQAIDRKGEENNLRIQALHAENNGATESGLGGGERYNQAEMLSMENEKLVKAWLSLLERFTVIEDQVKLFKTNVILSKYKILRKLRSMGLHEKFLDWLDKSGVKVEWDAAQELKTDDPLFQEWREKAQKALDLDDESFDKFIRDSEKYKN